MRTASCSERGDGCPRHDLDPQADVHQDAEEAIPFCCGLFCAYNARVDSDVGRAAVAVVGSGQGGNVIDAREGSKDKQLVIGGNETAGIGLYDCWGCLFSGVGWLGVVAFRDVLLNGSEPGKARFFRIKGCQEAPDQASTASSFRHYHNYESFTFWRGGCSGYAFELVMRNEGRRLYK